MTGPRPYPGPPGPPVITAGTDVATVVAPNPLWASNGIVVGPDGRLWIAQFMGGVISALDVGTGVMETLLGPDGPLVAPDDLTVDRTTGAAYIVDLPAGLVWRRDPDGTTTVVADGIASPDGVVFHSAAGAPGRLFVNELVPEGRLLEIDLDGGPPRVMATGLALGNAMEVGPDGRLYYPHIGGGEVWRVGLDGGTPERVIGDLTAPVAVRFSPEGRLLVLSNTKPVVWVHDPVDGAHLDTVDVGIEGPDNLVVAADGTWYVTGSFEGGVMARHPDGTLSTVLPPGLCGPYGLVATGTGSLLVADHHRVVTVGPDGALSASGTPWTGAPSGVRGVALPGRGPSGDTPALTSDHGLLYAGNEVRLDGLSDPAGLAVVDDGLLLAESGTGRVLHVADDDTVTERASGFSTPCDVTVSESGDVYVSDTERGQVIRLSDRAVLAAGLARPEGLVAWRGDLWCLEAGRGRLLRIDPRTRSTTTVVDGLPLAVAPTHAHPRHATNPVARRPTPFAGLTTDGDALIVGCSGDGSILRVVPARPGDAR